MQSNNSINMTGSTTNQLVIDCGGTIFKTNISTLCKAPFFESYINRWLENNSETIFVDQDPELFRHFLNLLRNPGYIIPDIHVENVTHIADYYGLVIEPIIEPVIEKKLKLCLNKSYISNGGSRYHDFNIDFHKYNSILDIYFILPLMPLPLCKNLTVNLICRDDDHEEIFKCNSICLFSEENYGNNKMIIRIKEIYFKYLQNTINMKVNFNFKNHIDCKLKCIIAYDYY